MKFDAIYSKCLRFNMKQQQQEEANHNLLLRGTIADFVIRVQSGHKWTCDFRNDNVNWHRVARDWEVLFLFLYRFDTNSIILFMFYVSASAIYSLKLEISIVEKHV